MIDFPIHIDTMSMGLSILYLSGHSLIHQNFCNEIKVLMILELCTKEKRCKTSCIIIFYFFFSNIIVFAL